MGAQLILWYRRDVAPMESHLGLCRGGPTISFASIGGVGGTRFHISQVMGRGLCDLDGPYIRAKARVWRPFE